LIKEFKLRLLWTDRRTFLAFFGITILAILSLVNKMDVAGSVTTIVMAVAAANSAQAIFSSKSGEKIEVKTENKE